MRHTNTHILARAKKVLSAWTVACIVMTLVRGPSAMVQTAEAASSFRPTIFVNTEAFLIIDDDDTTADVVMRFGDTLAKTLSFNRSFDRFEFNDDVYVNGTVQASNTLSGAVVYGAKSLRSSGSLVWEGAASGSTLIVSNSVGIAVTAAKAKLSVNGIMSGVTLYATKSFSGAGLSDCDTAGTSKLLWDATTGRFSCGTDANTTYTAGQGLSLNGTSFRLNTTVTGSLASFQTVSGATVKANNLITSSGAIHTESGAHIDGNTFVVQGGNNRVGIGTSDPDTALDVVGTISGSAVTQNGNTNNSFMGNVGIGTTAPDTILYTKGANPILTFENTSDHTGKSFFGTFNDATRTLIQLSANRKTSDGSVPDASRAPAYMDIVSTAGNGYIDFSTTVTNGGSPTTAMRVNGNGNVGIGTNSTTPDTKLEVSGAISGSFIYATRSFSGAGLSDCDTAGTSKLLWDATTGRFSCGTDTDTNTTYTAGQGLNLNGTSFRLNTTVTGSLASFQTVSGALVKASRTLASSGSLVVEGDGMLGDSSSDTLIVNANIGSSLIPTANVTFDIGALNNSWATGYFNTLEAGNLIHSSGNISANAVIATNGYEMRINADNGDTDAQISFHNDDRVRAFVFDNVLEDFRIEDTLRASGSLLVTGTVSGARLGGMGLTDCDTGGTSKLLWDATTGRFSCGTDSGATYTAGQGLALNGTSFRLNATVTGSVIKAATSLASSGTLVWEGAASGSTLTVSTGLTVHGDAMIGTNTNDSLTAFSNTTFMNAVTLGSDSSDTIMFGGQIGTALMPSANQQYNIGDESAYWNYGYFTNLNTLSDMYAQGNISAYDMTVRNVSNCNGANALATDGNGLVYCDTDDNTGYDDWGNGFFNIGDGTTYESIVNNDILNFADGTGIDVVVSATDTVTISSNNVYANDMNQNVGTDDSVQFLSLSVSSAANFNDNVSIGDGGSDNVNVAANTWNYTGQKEFNFDSPANFNMNGGRLSVYGTLSGATIYAARAFSGAGLTDCDGGTSKLLWDATTSRFSCGTVSSATYTAGQGLTLNGTSFRLNATVTGSLASFQTVSGAIVKAKSLLSSSGTLVVESGAYIAGTTLFVQGSGSGFVGIGTATPPAKLSVQETAGSFNANAKIASFAQFNGRALQILAPGQDNADSPFTLQTNNALNFRIDNTDAMTIDTYSNVGVGTLAPKSKFAVTGTISGATVYATKSFSGAGLSDCDTGGTSKLLWDATTGRFSCGTDTDTNTTYTAGQGLSLNGTSFRLNAAHSGTVISATTTLASSGTLVWEGAASGSSLIVSGNVGVGVIAAKAKLAVNGVMSGVTLYATKSFSGAGLSDCDTAGTSKLLWDATTGRFSCGTDTDTNTTYTAGQGLTLNGTSFRLNAAHSGTVIQAATTLASSGTLVWEGAASGSSLVVSNATSLKGNVALGDNAGDTITFNGLVNSTVTPSANNTYDFGSSSARWAAGWFNSMNISAGLSVAGTTGLTGNVGIGTANSTTKAVLNVSGVMSGVTVYATRSFSGAGLSDCDTGGTSKLLWDATTGRFSCGTDTDTNTTYTAGQGLSLNGTSFRLNAAHSGTVISATTTLASSGTLVWEGAGSGSSLSLAGGNVNIAQNGTAVFNENGADVDFRVESDANSNFFFIDASARSGQGAVGIGVAPDTGGPALRIDGETWQLGSGNTRTLVGETTSNYGGFQWIDATNVFQIGSGTPGFDMLSFYENGDTVVNEPGRDNNFRIESDTDANAFVVDGGLNSVGIGTAAPRTKLDVVGAISGSFIYATKSFSGAGLTDCDSASSKLLWDATTGRFSCGTVTTTNWSNTGSLQTYFDNRYVNTAGDTMTGALTVQNGTVHAATLTTLLNVRGTMSGRSLTISGSGASPLLSTSLGKPTVRIGGSGSLVLETRSSDPGSAPANTVGLFAQKTAGRPMLMQASGATMAATALQTALFGNQIMFIKPGGGATLTADGTQTLDDTTVSHPAADQVFGFMANFATAATSGDDAGTSSSNTAAFRGSTAGANGFFYMARVGVVDTTSIRTFTGMADQLISTMVSADNPSGNFAGFQFSTPRGDTNWQFTTKDNSTQSTVNTGMAFSANKVYDLYFMCTKQCAAITWEIRNVTDGTSAAGTTSSNLPTTTAAMRMVLGVESETTAAKNIRMQQIYFESDR